MVDRFWHLSLQLYKISFAAVTISFQQNRFILFAYRSP